MAETYRIVCVCMCFKSMCKWALETCWNPFRIHFDYMIFSRTVIFEWGKVQQQKNSIRRYEYESVYILLCFEYHNEHCLPVWIYAEALWICVSAYFVAVSVSDKWNISGQSVTIALHRTELYTRQVHTLHVDSVVTPFNVIPLPRMVYVYSKSSLHAVLFQRLFDMLWFLHCSHGVSI